MPRALRLPTRAPLPASEQPHSRVGSVVSWLSREPAIILLRKSDQPATGVDHRHLLTLRRVFQIALTAELMRLGVTAQRAGNLAALFTDQGGERPAVRPSNPDYAHRLPGHLFANGSTVLVANKGRFGPIISAVTNTPFAEVFTRHNSNVLVVNVGEMVDRVLAALRLTEQGTASADQAVGSCRPLLFKGSLASVPTPCCRKASSNGLSGPLVQQ
jgi:hypothetical protein